MSRKLTNAVIQLLWLVLACDSGGFDPHRDRAATKLAFTVQPTGAAADAAISPTVAVTVQDADGNTVTSASTSITVAIETNPALGTLSGTATVTAVNGVATFPNLSINHPGTGYTLTASAVGLNGATSASFDVFAMTYSISGAVSGAIDGVLITLSGTTTGTTTTTSGGLYLLSGLPNGNYTLTASKAGYVMSPASIAVAVNGRNVTGQNFLSASAVCSAENWRWRNPLPQGNLLFGVWGSGASDVWAVGWSGTILHWDGSAWTSVSSSTPTTLFGVWGSGASDVWAVGWAGTIVHWNGSAWATASSGTTNPLWGVWGSGASDVWAVGHSGTIVHWNGSAWTSVSSDTPNILYSVWGSGASDVWAVGDSGTILHWNGSAWTSVSSDTTNILNGIWGRAASDVWAVGGPGTILHWNGIGWTSVTLG